MVAEWRIRCGGFVAGFVMYFKPDPMLCLDDTEYAALYYEHGRTM